MRSQVHVHKQALAGLKAGLFAFKSRASEQLNALDLRLRHDLALFQQVVQHAQVEVRQCQERLQQQSHASHQGDEWALREARQRLRQAEQRLELACRSTREVEQAIQTYTQQAYRLYNHLEHGLPRSAAALDRKIAALEHYEALATAAHEPIPVPLAPGLDTTDIGPPQILASRLLAQMGWIQPKYWGTILEITVLVMAGAQWMSQLPTTGEIPAQYIERFSAFQDRAERLGEPQPEVAQLNDWQGIQSEQRKEEQRRRLTDKPQAAAGLDPPQD
ncbi:MAG: hypothetical protein EOM24_24025 [Chloroflexia bacterium]|nr:hypothetical protein [Chloroflexia bacterium]